MFSQLRRRADVIACGVALALFMVQIIFLVLFRQVNLDEGWYLWASKLVYEGKLLYRDFAFTQTPVLPYVYGLFQLVLGEGLHQGRIITAIFAILMFLTSGLVANRIGGIWAQFICWALLVTSLYSNAFYSYSATYALTAFLVVLAIYLALDPPSIKYRNAAAVICLVLAVGTRLSAIVALIPFVAYLIATSEDRRRSGIEISSAILLSFILLFGPFLAMSGKNMLYDIFGFHIDRMTFELRIQTMRRSVGESIGDFLVPMILSIGGLFAWAVGTSRADNRRVWIRHSLPELFVGSIAVALFVVHLVPQTTSSYYNSLIVPLLSILGGVILIRAFSALEKLHAHTSRWAGYVLLTVVLALNVFLQAHTLLRYDLIRFPLKNQIEIVRTAARFLNEALPGSGTLLTFDTHLALEANMEVPSGFEMSIFSYRPAWTTPRSRQYRVVNNALLLEALRSGADAVAMTTFDLDLLYGERELLLNTLHNHYRWAKTVPGFGPFQSDLRIYLPPQYDLPTPDVPLEVHWDDEIVLLGYDLERRLYNREESLWLTLYWQAETSPHDSYVVFTHLVNESGEVALGWDNPPCRRTCPTNSWRAGEIIRDEYVLPLKESLPAGLYYLEVGIYDLDTGDRLIVSSDSTQVIDNGLFLEQVEVR